MCALFVRDVFQKANVPVGVAKEPSDLQYLNPGEPQGPSYANSFAGTDVGMFVDWTKGLVRAGDIVMTHTLDDWHTNAITHVGIAVDEYHWVHRPTQSAPVKYGLIPWHQVRKVVRPHGYTQGDLRPSFRKLGYYQHDTEAQLTIDDKPDKSLVAIDITNGVSRVNINGRERQVVAVTLEVKFRDVE